MLFDFRERAPQHFSRARLAVQLTDVKRSLREERQLTNHMPAKCATGAIEEWR
jgi:hypothetical protein